MKQTGKSQRLAPLSIRLSEPERARLERDASGLSLSAYIKDRLFGNGAPHRMVRGKAPKKDHQALAQIMAQLGVLQLANNLNIMARAAESGSLALDLDTHRALTQACADIDEMRCLLLRGLGIQEHVRQPERSAIEATFNGVVDIEQLQSAP